MDNDLILEEVEEYVVKKVGLQRQQSDQFLCTPSLFGPIVPDTPRRQSEPGFMGNN